MVSGEVVVHKPSQFPERDRVISQLGLAPNDPILPKFTDISDHFAHLSRQYIALPQDTRDIIYHKDVLYCKTPGSEAVSDESLGLRYGIHYIFGWNHGQPRSVRENAAAAIFDGRQGVPLWRIMKSIAYTDSDGQLVVVHLRGDREIDEELPFVKSLTKATEEQFEQLGVEYGTVNPFMKAKAPIYHAFDRDLVGGEDYPEDDFVFTSSGDPRFYVGFDIREYLMAISHNYATRSTTQISKVESKKRIIARQPIVIIGGDSGIDTSIFGQTVMAAITRELQQNGVYYGDRSLPPTQILSLPGLASSINTGLYGLALQAEVRKAVGSFSQTINQGKKPIITFSSMAMHGIAGEILRYTEGTEYVGPQEAVENLLKELRDRQIDITHTLLLGLPSAYDGIISAFAGDILNKAPVVNKDLQRQIQSFVQECKMGETDPLKFYQIIEKLLRNATSSEFEALKGRNVVIVLGASELASFANKFHQIPKTFAVIKSSNPDSIAEEITKAPDNRIRLILISPSQALAEIIAQKTMG